VIPSPAIRVVEQTSSKLVLLYPPNYLFGGMLLLVSLLLLFLTLVLYRIQVREPKVNWLTTGLGIFFILLGLLYSSNHTVFTFSREAGRLSISRSIFGITSRDTDVPLQDIRKAAVETTGNQRRLVLVMNSGSVLRMTFSTRQASYYATADVINAFLVTAASR